MSNVTLLIGGRQYMVACDAGQEAHVANLGDLIETKVREIGAAGHNEVRLLLFAALVLADENHELKANGGAGPLAMPVSEDAAAGALEALAERLEKCAVALERHA